jgi:hypothetical protein
LRFRRRRWRRTSKAASPTRGKQFFSEAKAFRETPGWKKLEQVVAIATKLSGEAATQAEAAQHQRVIDTRLETPAETARYLSDLAFSQTKGSEGPTGIVVEYTTHPVRSPRRRRSCRAPSVQANASDFAPRAAVPPGYEPVAGGSLGCPAVR